MSGKPTTKPALKPTTPAEWRRRAAAGQFLKLPSGLTVRARKYNVLELIAAGVPAEAEPVFLELLASDAVMEITQFKKFAQIIDLVVAGALIEPAIAETGDDSHLTIAEVPAADRLFIFNWCNAMRPAVVREINE